MKKRIILVDDEKDILEVISYNLQKEGYSVHTAENGNALFEYDLAAVDLIILDIMIPGMDGYQICEKLKKDPVTARIPVIFLTARTAETDEIQGLELGAEDYLVKPVSVTKLLARIKKVFRREAQIAEMDRFIPLDDMTVDVANYCVKIEEEDVPFTKKEFESFLYLIRHRGKIVTREALMDAIWEDDVLVGHRTIDVHIRRIREKLGDRSEVIETIKGIGYRLRQ